MLVIKVIRKIVSVAMAMIIIVRIVIVMEGDLRRLVRL